MPKLHSNNGHSNNGRNGHTTNGKLTDVLRKSIVTKLRDDAATLRKQGKAREAQTLMFKASEVALKVGEGPYKKAAQ